MAIKKINISDTSKVVIKWDVLPIDYSREGEIAIISKFAQKYNISKDNIKVEPRFIKKKENGENVPYSSDIVNNINDPIFQQNLFSDYIKEKNIESCDFEKIIEIDNFINNQINYDRYDKNKKYTIKWIKWSNFMSYGKDNFIDLTNLNGLVLLSSTPSNQGGKSTFCVDLIRFLLFGKVTSRENDWTLSKVFNKHLPEATEVYVEGCVDIDGIDYIIKRTVTRPQLSKRSDKSKVVHKVNYYKVVNDTYIDLIDDENQEGSSTTETNKIIKESIGNERDFDLMISVNSDNLKSLISLKDTDRGKLLARWIGLLPLEEKDKIAREIFNRQVTPKLLLNRYDKEELLVEIKNLSEENEQAVKELESLNKRVASTVNNLNELNEKRDILLQSKTLIDETLVKIDVKTLETQLSNIEERGKTKNVEKENSTKRYDEIKDVIFNENEYFETIENEKKISIDINLLNKSIAEAKIDIISLKNGEICPTCKRKLDNVDNSKLIDEKDAYINSCTTEINLKNELLSKTIEKRKELDYNRALYNEKLRVELIISKIEVDIDNLRKDYREKRRLLKDIEANKSAIERNNLIEIKIRNTDVNIKTENDILLSLNNKINDCNILISNNEKTIAENSKLIEAIEKDEILLRNWRVYLELIGKNGISKMVLRNTLPIINGELSQLLNNVCDFTIEVEIDDKQDVSFVLIHDGVRSSLSSGSGFEQTVSSLALRSVLSKISTFSKPSFVVFDEILGGVADENYDSIKLLYDKIISNYGTIMEITHNKNIHDWHNKSILISKNNNISSLSVL